MNVTATTAGLAPLLQGVARAPRRHDTDRLVPHDDRTQPRRRSRASFEAQVGSHRAEAETARRLGQSPFDRVARPGTRAEAPAPNASERPRAPDVGAWQPSTAATAFMAQYLVQEVMPEDGQDQPGALRQGLLHYRRAMAQGIAVIGPANFSGLVV